MLERARGVAKDVLGKNPSGGGSSVHVHHSCSPWCWWFFPTYQPVIIDNRSMIERANARRAFWGVVLGIIGLGVSYFIGRDFGKLREAEGELTRIHRERNIYCWKYKESRDSKCSDIRKIREVLQGERQIFLRMRREAALGLALKVSLLASTIIGVVGAVIAAPALMALAGVGVFASSCAMLIYYGVQSTDKRNEKDAEWILKTTKPLLAR